MLIVGDGADPHAEEVGSELRSLGCTLVMLDAASIEESRWRWHQGSFSAFSDGGWISPVRGWFRRLAPPGQHVGVAIGGREAAEASARLTLLSSLSDASIEWISDYWSLARAESKLVQYRAASELGIQVPSTSVVARAIDIEEQVGPRFIVKPLGVGSYTVEDTSYAVHTRLVERDDPVLDGLSVAPFLTQQFIEATAHLRIVTVGPRAWSARLDATGLPIDWRQNEAAHASWEPISLPDVEARASSLADRLRLRFTSQDWIVDTVGVVWFIDANPSGQWLFLPPEISWAATSALSRWLAQGHWEDR